VAAEVIAETLPRENAAAEVATADVPRDATVEVAEAVPLVAATEPAPAAPAATVSMSTSVEQPAAAEEPVYVPRAPGRASNDPRERRRRERELVSQQQAAPVAPAEAAQPAATEATPAPASEDSQETSQH
jgi:ribonuclease E